MSMTRKDYGLVAEAINDELARHDSASAAADALRDVAYDLAEDFKGANERFDVRRFLQACGARP